MGQPTMVETLRAKTLAARAALGVGDPAPPAPGKPADHPKARALARSRAADIVSHAHVSAIRGYGFVMHDVPALDDGRAAYLDELSRLPDFEGMALSEAADGRLEVRWDGGEWMDGAEPKS